MTTSHSSWLPTACVCLLLLGGSALLAYSLPAPWGARVLVGVCAAWLGLTVAKAPRGGGWSEQLSESLLRWLMCAAVLLPHVLLAEWIVGPALGMVSRAQGPGPAVLLAALLALQILLWWRWWPAPGLIWGDRLESEKSRWASLGLERALFLRRSDQFWRHGLWVALCLAAAVLICGLLAWYRRALDPLLSLPAAVVLIGTSLGISVLLLQRARLAELSRPKHLSFLDEDAEAEKHPTQPEAGTKRQPDDDANNDRIDANGELLEAARRGDGLAVEAALAAGADANTRPTDIDPDQRDALTRAAACGQIHALRALLQARAEVNPQCVGAGPLMAATQASFAGRAEVVSALLANGANPQVFDDLGRTPLHHAALCRDPAVAQALLDAGADLDALDHEGYSALARAAEQQNLELMEHLIGKGANLHPTAGIAIIQALCRGPHDNTAGLTLLLKHKAKPNAVDGQGLNALQWSARHGHAALVEALLEAGAAVNHLCSSGRTALHWAAEQGHERVLQRLAFWQPKGDLIDNAGDSALHLAVRAEGASAETVGLLLALGVPANQLNGGGKSAVDLALAQSRWPLVRAIDPSVTIPSSFSAEENEEADQGEDRPKPSVAVVDPDQVLLEALRKGRDPLVRELLRTGSISPPGLRDALVLLAEVDRADLAAQLFAAGLDPVADEPAALEALLSLDKVPVSLVETCLQYALKTEKSRVLLPLAGARGDAIDEDWLTSLLLKALAGGANPSVRDRARRSPLHLALLRRGNGFVDSLLRARPGLNAVERGGLAPLHLLAMRNSLERLGFARAMIRAGADPAVIASDGRTPCGIALASGATKLAVLLDWPILAHPARALRDADLSRAARAGDRATVQRLLQLGLPVDGRDERGATALVHAAGAGHLDLVTELLAADADPEVATDSGATALSAACVSGHKSVIGLLLTAGVDVDQRMREGLTPLMIAASVLRTDMVELLLERGANVNIVAQGALTALEAAVMSALSQGACAPALACVRVLLKNGARVSAATSENGGLLHRVLGGGQTRPPAVEDALCAMLQMLLSKDVTVDTLDVQLRTPLHWACRHSLLRCAEQLIDHGAQRAPEDDMGQTPFDLLAPRWRPALGNKLAEPPGRKR